MCGIVAIVTSDAADLAEQIQTMNGTIVHRGPDDAGSAVLPTEGVALAMRRLSILDLEGGHQPMWNEDERYGIVFNGEIYNYAGLRQQLVDRGHRFQTDHSDTEVLLHGYEEWGPELLPRLNGMFAFAIWDRVLRRLFVARDRTGEKPLYVARIPGGYAIASELKALLSHPGVEHELDPVAVEQFLAFDFILTPRSILKGTRKLPAGCYAYITPDRMEVSRYWTLTFNKTALSEHEALQRLDELLDRAVQEKMVADVPVGLFLSGGLDSTTAGWYMTRHSSQVNSFSIGFDNPRFDESQYAELAARHLGTRHHLEVFSEDRIRDLVPKITDLLDEPMADQSIFPTYLVSTVARRHVKVVLGGDGSDEVLMGYTTYKALKLASLFDPLPLLARRQLAALARTAPARVGPFRLRAKRFVERLDRPTGERLLSHLGSFAGDARWVLADQTRAQLPQTVFDGLPPVFRGRITGPRLAGNQAVAAYVAGYLQDDILVKVDRASMATSLEVRAPFLDAELIDFLAGVSPALKLHGLTGKYLLRRLMRGRLPDAILDRRKQGFGVPLNAWLRTSLAPLLREYLDPHRLAQAGILDPFVVDGLVKEHISGTRDRGQQLWPLLLLELWRERWLKQPMPAYQGGLISSKAS